MTTTKGRKFIAVDLDGTLAEWDTPEERTLYRRNGRSHIGQPIAPMVQRVKDWLSEGHVVFIFTARVSDPTKPDHAKVVTAIERWCEKHIGQLLHVTAVKQPFFSSFWDDRAVRVVNGTPCCEVAL